ncbi:DUF1254 domain-containing protein [Nocardia jejuensis]|uniref:DUF1254 domain-containing protein n=1 Tax=Nocardia jejuensis TaxID=328049 RepID=UPI000A074084|nr:DUF1254 domain-containing protein [Nocardia jejuensis]
MREDREVAQRGTGSGARGGRSRRSFFGLAAAGTAAFALAACSSDNTSSDSGSGSSAAGSGSEDPKSIAIDAYVFGYPLVLMDVTRTQAEAVTPVNRFQHATTLPGPERRDVVRLNLDTLYSMAWLDLAAEPVVLQIPEVPDNRYWLMQIMDAWSNTQHDPGSVRPQVKSGASAPPYTYALTGPGWSGSLPDSVTQLAVPTPTAWILGRIEVNGNDDIPNVEAVQQKMKLVPLSDWTAGRDAPVAPTVPADTSMPPVKEVAAMDAAAFFQRVDALLAVNPPAAADADAMSRFAKIGVTPGGTVTGISAEDLTAAASAAAQRIQQFDDPEQKDENGWKFATDVGTYGTDYLLRANIALQGLGANLPRDAVYPTIFTTADTNGTPKRFRLRFAAGQTPPVDAFWSITAYDADGFLIPNSAAIYAIGHQVPVTLDPDGSLNLVVQNADPGPDVPQGNWLPIPAAGPFSLTLRMYSPKDNVIDGSWQVPALNTVS